MAPSLLYFPTYSYVAGLDTGGHLPPWNPFIFSGMPLAADVQTGLFYPFNWIISSCRQAGCTARSEWLLIPHYWLASVSLITSSCATLAYRAWGLYFRGGGWFRLLGVSVTGRTWGTADGPGGYVDTAPCCRLVRRACPERLWWGGRGQWARGYAWR